MAKKTLNVGIAGLGTVGAGVFTLLADKAAAIEKRTGRKVRVVAVSARDRKKKRGIRLNGVTWYKDPLKLAKDKNVDVVVELIGGADGVAHKLAESTLAGKKHFVTANKALLSRHGVALARLAEKHGVALAYEAAVAGGIPVIAVLRQCLTANRIGKVVGILNGTCNYILTAMQKDKKDFASILREAQELGYAEADPGFDIDGVDTAHKLSILSALAFGSEINCRQMHVEGIRGISLQDIAYADELGYKIKLLGITERSGRGIAQRVYPCLVAKESPVAQVDGVLNAVSIESDVLGPLFLEGPGAGRKPTASAVVADIVDIAAGRCYDAFGLPVKQLQKAKYLTMDAYKGEYYIKFTVRDEPGVLAAITAALSKEGIGVEQLLQPHTRANKTADIVITTHVAAETAINNALRTISKKDAVLEAPHVLRIEN